MKSVAQRHAEHRRLVRIGVGASAVLHAALFAWITLPVIPFEGEGDEERERRRTDAIEVISIRVPSPAALTVDATASAVQSEASGSAFSAGRDAADVPVRTAGAATDAPPASTAPAITTEAPAVATEAPAAVERLEVSAARAIGDGIRIGELGEISAVEPGAPANLAAHDHDHGPGFWERIFGDADITIQHGGICPIDGQPLWGSGGRAPEGFSIPSVRDGGLTLPGGAKIGLPRGRRPGGVVRPGGGVRPGGFVKPGGIRRPGIGSGGPTIIRR